VEEQTIVLHTFAELVAICRCRICGQAIGRRKYYLDPEVADGMVHADCLGEEVDAQIEGPLQRKGPSSSGESPRPPFLTEFGNSGGSLAPKRFIA
jgi:hypothetical protein